jgi:hypothetical protein
MLSNIDNRDTQSLNSNLNEITTTTNNGSNNNNNNNNNGSNNNNNNNNNNDSDDSSQLTKLKPTNRKNLIENLNQIESNVKPFKKNEGFIKGLKLIVSRSDSNANIRAQVRKPSSGNLNHLNLDKLIHNFFKSKFIKV